MNTGKYVRSYRFTFQSQESDDEIRGKGNSLNYKFRMHDPRIGRFFAVDPLAAKYPWNSSYAFSENRVIDYIELEGLEAWSIKNEWDSKYISSFRRQVNSKISGYKKNLDVFTCDDLSMELAISFARDNNLPFKWHTGSGIFDASSEKYSDYETFLNDVKTHSGAPDYADEKNTYQVNYNNISTGTLVVLKAEGNDVPNHIQVVTYLHSDEGVLKGYNASQGNFNALGRLLGSSNPKSILYLGVTIQDGYYSQELDTWNNVSKRTLTTDFFEDHYSGEYREFDFNGMNTKNTTNETKSK